MGPFGRMAPVLLALAFAACGGGGDRPKSGQWPPADSTGRPSAEVARGGEPRDRDRPRFRAVVALEQADAVAILAGPPWRRVRRVDVAPGPHNVDASPTGFVAVTSPPADAVTILGARGHVRKRVRISGAPHDSTFTAGGKRLWIAAERGRRLVQVAVRSGRVLRSVQTTGAPHDLTATRGGRELWITIDGSSAVERRSAVDGELLGTARPGGAPHDLAVEPGGRRVWLSNWTSPLLTVASARSGRALRRVAAGVEPHHFAFTARRAWASDNASGAVYRIGLRTARVLGRTAVGPSPHHVAAAGDGVLVAIHGSGRVVALSRRGRAKASIRAGAGPHGIAVVPAG